MLIQRMIHTEKHPFSRSYGVILPSSLTRVLSSALVHLHPPTCVGFRYGLQLLNFRSFSRQRGISSTLRLDTLGVVKRGLTPSAYGASTTMSNGWPEPILLRPS